MLHTKHDIPISVHTHTAESNDTLHDAIVSDFPVSMTKQLD